MWVSVFKVHRLHTFFFFPLKNQNILQILKGSPTLPRLTDALAKSMTGLILGQWSFNFDKSFNSKNHREMTVLMELILIRKSK